MKSPDVAIGKADLMFKILAGESMEASCVKCGMTEIVIPLEEPTDEIFLANYHCEECEASEGTEAVKC